MKICIHETETVKSVIVILLNSTIQNVFDKKWHENLLLQNIKPIMGK